MQIMDMIIVALGSYLLGSIPFGVLVAKAFGIGDLRNAGSGNIGATNAYRVGGKKVGILTLILDAAKGYIAVYVTGYLFPLEQLKALAMLAVMCGHCFPIWLKFKGGKGVATMVASYLAISPMLGLIVILTWVTLFLLKRISSLASLVAAVVGFCVFAYGEGEISLSMVAIFIAILIVFIRHKENITRLLHGEEKAFK
jgi:glycerol-3-phosphate acyltransferase PlsY